MTVSYFVRYEVEAPEEFIRHYRDRQLDANEEEA
jgi:hypothetical protein